MSDDAPALAQLAPERGVALRHAVAALDMADPDGCPLPQLTLNSSGVPGALGFELDGPVKVGDLEWTSEDAGPWAAPIGAALAYEAARREKAECDVA